MSSEVPKMQAIGFSIEGRNLIGEMPRIRSEVRQLRQSLNSSKMIHVFIKIDGSYSRGAESRLVHFLKTESGPVAVEFSDPDG